MNFLRKLLGAVGDAGVRGAYNTTRLAAQLNPADGGATWRNPYGPGNMGTGPRIPVRPVPQTPSAIATAVSPYKFQQNGVVYRNPDNSRLTMGDVNPIITRPSGNLSGTDFYQAVPLAQPNFPHFEKLRKIGL